MSESLAAPSGLRAKLDDFNARFGDKLRFYGRGFLVLATIAALIFAGITALGVAFQLPLGPIEHTTAPDVQHLRGVYHVLPLSADGDPRHEDMLRAAKEADLDFVLFTQSGSEPYRGLTEGENDPIAIAGVEFDTGAGWVSFIGPDAQLKPGQHPSDPAAEVAERLNAKTPPGITIAAHPYTWGKSWDLRQLSPSESQKSQQKPLLERTERVGVEFTSAREQIQDESVFPYLVVAWSSWLWWFNAPHAMLYFYDRPNGGLKLWDELNVQGKRVVPGFCAADSDQLDPDLTLRTFGTYIPLPAPAPTDPKARREAILDALTSGQSYCALDLLGEARGFTMHVADGQQRHNMGARVPLNGTMELNISTPLPKGVSVRISVFKNGDLLTLKADRTLKMTLEDPGVYRAEVDLRVDKPGGQSQWMPWIYSNPIHLTKAAP